MFDHCDALSRRARLRYARARDRGRPCGTSPTLRYRAQSLDMAWAILLVAAVFEIGWAVGLKYTHGFTRFWPTAWTVTALVLSFALLAFAVRSLPIGTGYAVWAGIGAAGTALFGVWLVVV